MLSTQCSDPQCRHADAWEILPPYYGSSHLRFMILEHLSMACAADVKDLKRCEGFESTRYGLRVVGLLAFWCDLELTVMIARGRAI